MPCCTRKVKKRLMKVVSAPTVGHHFIQRNHNFMYIKMRMDDWVQKIHLKLIVHFKLLTLTLTQDHSHFLFFHQFKSALCCFHWQWRHPLLAIAWCSSVGVNWCHLIRHLLWGTNCSGSYFWLYNMFDVFFSFKWCKLDCWTIYNAQDVCWT